MKKVLWSNGYDIIENLMDYIKNEEYAKDWDENIIYDCAYTDLMDSLDYVMKDCDIQLDNDIICIANMGRWNGTATGYKLIESGNIKDCFISECDTVEYYIDRYNNFRCSGSHHDGCNEYLFRELKDISDEQLDNFTDKIYRGECTSKDITRYTREIGSHIKW